MSYPPEYDPTTSFADEESNQASGRSTVNTAKLDTELADISSSINALIENQAAVLRDDDKLKDLLVEPYALAEQTRAMMAAAGRTPRGAWTINTDYEVGDLVQRNAIAYICQTEHNSGPTFNSGFWLAISGDGTAASSAADATASAAAAAASASAASTSATNAATSASSAATSATNAAASQLAAQNAADSIAALTPVNLTAYMQDLLANSNAAGVLGDLGVSAFVQTMLNDTTAAEARATLGAVGRVANLTALRALAEPPSATTVYMESYSTAGDGGGGPWLWDASSTAVDNGITVVQPNSAPAAGRWLRLYSGNLNAAWAGFSESATAATNTSALQAVINVAKTIVETILANKYVIATADVDINPGKYNVSGSVAVYTAVRVIGAGQSNTLLIHDGGASHFFIYTQSASEYLYNTWVMDLAFKGAGKTTTDTLSFIKADRSTDGLAIYGCGVTRCLITNCYEAVNLQNCWTFEISDCEIYDVGRNFVRGLNVTAATVKNNRMDTAGEDGLFLTFSTTAALETVALLLEDNVIQSCQRRGIYGYDCDHAMWDHNYVENCNQAGGYPHVEFDSVSGTNAEMYSFVGGWISPSSNSGQPAVKIDKARFVSGIGTYIRGANFTYGFELGADVEGYSLHCEAATANGLVNVSEDTTGIGVGRLKLTLHGIDSETHTPSATSSNANSSLSVRQQEISCAAGNRIYTLLDAHLQKGRRFTVQKTDGGGNQLIIAPSGTTKINGVNASVNSTAAYARAEILCGYEPGTTTLCWYVKFI